MRWATALLTTILLLPAAALVAVAAEPEAPTLTVPAEVKIRPGGNATITIAVANPGVAAAQYKIELKWVGAGAGKLSWTEEAVEVPPGCAETLNVTINVPPDTEPGFYTLRVAGYAELWKGGYMEAAEPTVETVRIAVGGVGNSELRLVEIGEDYFVIRYRVDNALDRPVSGTLIVEVRRCCSSKELVGRREVPFTIQPGASAEGVLRFDAGPGGYTVTSRFVYGGGETRILTLKTYAGIASISYRAGWKKVGYREWVAFLAIKNNGTIPLVVTARNAYGYTATFQLMPGEEWRKYVDLPSKAPKPIEWEITYGYGDYMRSAVATTELPSWWSRHEEDMAVVGMLGLFTAVLMSAIWRAEKYAKEVASEISEGASEPIEIYYPHDILEEHN